VTGLNERAVIDRRFIFLEGEKKRHDMENAELRQHLQASSEQVATLRSEIAQLRVRTTESDLPVTLRARTAQKTARRIDNAGTMGPENGFEPAGKNVMLVYPMVREGDDVWMRRLHVDPRTAHLTWEWLHLYRDSNADPSEGVFVTDFE